MDLATRGQRLLAVFLDSALISAVFAIAAYEGLPDAVRFLGLIAAAGVFAGNLWLLAKRGQTVGKRVVGIRIVLAETQENGGFIANVLKRGVLAGLPYFVLTLFTPVIGAVYVWTDILLIFRGSRRCLHDVIAGTVVIQNEPAAV